MTTERAPELEAMYPTSPTASLWLDDLRWHRVMYRDSRFRWYTSDVLDIVTWHTGGQTEFTSVEDLRTLQVRQYLVLHQAEVARNAMADRLALAYEQLAGEWSAVVDALGLTELDCRVAMWFAQHADDAERESTDVRRVLSFVPFRNPLIEAFELKQLMRLYEAAGDMLEDAICDLISELLPTRPEAVVAAAADTHGTGGLAQRVAQALTERGGAGDARRVPEQRF